jgi:ubiquinone biosynthesis protein
MRIWARAVSRIPTLGSLQFEAAVQEFGRAVFAQLDFRVEARNNRRFRENFRGNADVVFPEVIESLCSSRILCMTFIEGTKVLAWSRTWSDPRRMARVGLLTMLKMIFEDGFVHADLHPGNIFITADHKLALLDLGLVGELDPPHRRSFARFFTAWAQRDGDTMARLLYAMSSADPSDQLGFERFRSAMIEFVGRYWGQRMGEVQVGKVLFDMLAILRRHRIRMNPAFTIVNIAIAVTEGIGKQLDPELDLMAVALPYFLAHPVAAEAS